MITKTMGRAALAVGLAAGLTWSATAASAADTDYWHQDFSTGADGWFDGDSGWVGTITHNAADGTATVASSYLGPISSFGAPLFFSPFEAFPGDHAAEIKVYLDPAWAAGTGFEYTIGTAQGFRYAVLGAVDTTGLWVGSRYDFGQSTSMRTEVSANGAGAGWYTFQHVFTVVRDELVGDELHITANVFGPSGEPLLTDLFIDAVDPDQGPDFVSFSLFSAITVPDGVLIDDHRLYAYPPPPTGPQSKDECKKGGWEQFGFKNQGECVSSVAQADKPPKPPKA